MEAKAKRQRVVGTKYSKNGCKTCRIRRVKCDEGRPHCKNCVSTGRTCDGYNPGVTYKGHRALAPKRALLPSPATSPPIVTTIASPPSSCLGFNTTPDDQRAFQHFTKEVVTALGYITWDKRWINLTLQLAVTEPAIYYAVCAVGSVAWGRANDGVNHHTLLMPHPRIDWGLQQYCKATASLQKYINQAISRKASIEPVLLCCLMFVMYEVLQGDTSVALSHFRLGRRAIASSLSGVRRTKDNDAEGLTCLSTKSVDEITSAFDWLAIRTPDSDYAALIPDVQDTASLRAHSAPLGHAKQILDSLVASTTRWRRDLLKITEQFVATTEYANTRTPLRSCIAQCLTRAIPLTHESTLLRRHAELMQDHRAWLAEFVTVGESQPNACRQTMLLMQLQHLASYLVLCLSRETSGLAADHLEDEFVHGLNLVDQYVDVTSTCSRENTWSPVSEQTSNTASQSSENSLPYSPTPQRQASCESSERLEKTFSLEYAIVPVLMLVCLKCRSPDIRHRALELLRTANAREGIQFSGELVHYADCVVALEERHAVGSTNGLIPERARILDVTIENIGLLQIVMFCGRYRNEGDGELEITEYRGGGMPPIRLQYVDQHVFPFKAQSFGSAIAPELLVGDPYTRTPVRQEGNSVH